MPITLDGTLGITTPALTVTGATINTGGISTAGNLTFTSTGNRITGDFSNATVASRVMFQTSTTNGITRISAIPNGSGAGSIFTAYADADPTNSETLSIYQNSSASAITSSITGTGTYTPLTISTGGSERMRIDTSGNVGIGTASPLGKLAVVSSSGITGYGSANSPTLTVHASNRVANQEQQIFTVFTTDTPTVDFGGSIGLGGRSASASGDGNAYAQIAGRKENGTNANYAGYLQFSTSDVASDLTERMRIDSSGNVGIGTSSPTSGGKLDVNGIAYFGTGDKLKLYSNNILQNAGTLDIGTIGSAALAFNTANTERMRIDSSGNVLVGYSAQLMGSVNTFGCRTMQRSYSATAAMSGSTWVNLIQLDNTSTRVGANVYITGNENGAVNVYFAKYTYAYAASNATPYTLSGPFDTALVGNTYAVPNLRISGGYIQIQANNGLSTGYVNCYIEYFPFS